jgi:hypothetical protein
LSIVNCQLFTGSKVKNFCILLKRQQYYLGFYLHDLQILSLYQNYLILLLSCN